MVIPSHDTRVMIHIGPTNHGLVPSPLMPTIPTNLSVPPTTLSYLFSLINKGLYELGSESIFSCLNKKMRDFISNTNDIVIEDLDDKSISKKVG
jgi:hypothetical protein